MSPLSRFAQLYCEEFIALHNGLPIFYWTPGTRWYNPQEATAWMIAKVLLEGFDPHLTCVPTEGSRCMLLNTFIDILNSHRRWVSVAVILDSLGLYDDAPWAEKKWRIIVQRLLDCSKATDPELKPIKFLIVNPLPSKIIQRVMRSNGNIECLRCPNIKEFAAQK